MKSTGLFRRFHWSLALASILAALPAGAQTAAAPAADTNAPDALAMPDRDHLPGKPAVHIWSGLPKMWLQRRHHFQTTATNDTGAVVFLGDSITQGWNTLARDFPDLKVANRGISGDISSGVLYRLQTDVLDLHPAGIVLLIGTNDLGNSNDTDPADIASNIEAILAAIEKFNPNLRVIICKVMPRGEEAESHYVEKIKSLDAKLERIAKSNANFAICDTWTPFADEDGHPIAADFNRDQLHLNAAGYAVWRTALAPVIARENFTTAKGQ